MLIPTLLALFLCNRSPYITSAQALENAIPQSIKHFWKFRSEKISTLQHQNYISLKPHRILFLWKILWSQEKAKCSHQTFTKALWLHTREESQRKNSGRMRHLRWCVWSEEKYHTDFHQLDSMSTFFTCRVSPLHLTP